MVQRLTGIDRAAGRQLARPEDGITAIPCLVGRLQSPCMHHPNLTDQRQALGAHYLIEEVRKSGLQLGDFFAAVTL
ncbi:hypothetical protein D3C85_1395700 [compost metagenome]